MFVVVHSNAVKCRLPRGRHGCCSGCCQFATMRVLFSPAVEGWCWLEMAEELVQDLSSISQHMNWTMADSADHGIFQGWPQLLTSLQSATKTCDFVETSCTTGLDLSLAALLAQPCLLGGTSCCCVLGDRYRFCHRWRLFLGQRLLLSGRRCCRTSQSDATCAMTLRLRIGWTWQRGAIPLNSMNWFLIRPYRLSCWCW